MKLLIKNLVLFLFCSLMFLAACSSNSKEPSANDEGADTIMDVESDEEELPLALVHSVEELQLAIEDSMTEKASDKQVDPAKDLSSIEYFYVPKVKFDNHQLFQIEVSETSIIYYYVPKDNGKDQPFDHNTGITVTFSRTPDKDDPLAPLVKQAGISLTEDNILYEKNKNYVFFAVGDTYMSIKVPDELNDYDYLKNLGSAEKVEIKKVKPE